MEKFVIIFALLFIFEVTIQFVSLSLFILFFYLYLLSFFELHEKHKFITFISQNMNAFLQVSILLASLGFTQISLLMN